MDATAALRFHVLWRNIAPLALQAVGGFGRIWGIVKSTIEVERKAICGVRCLMACCAVGAALVAVAGDGKAIQPLERAATACPATNAVAAVAATNTFLAGIVVTNAADAALIKEIEAATATLADDIASEKRGVSRRIFAAISKLSCSDARLATRCEARVLYAALATRFERIGERVAQEYNDERARRAETFRRTFLAYGALEHIARGTALRHTLFTWLSVEDRWEPAFAYYERMKEEYVRMKQVDESYEEELRDMLSGWDENLEYCYELSLHRRLHHRRTSPPPEETAWFKRRFEEVVGRPPKVRSWEDMVKEREESEAVGPDTFPDDDAPSPLPETNDTSDFQ